MGHRGHIFKGQLHVKKKTKYMGRSLSIFVQCDDNIRAQIMGRLKRRIYKAHTSRAKRLHLGWELVKSINKYYNNTSACSHINIIKHFRVTSFKIYFFINQSKHLN